VISSTELAASTPDMRVVRHAITQPWPESQAGGEGNELVTLWVLNLSDGHHNTPVNI
jgi:hypothetical protein